jgi:solute carrier family 45, member 1/2/4
VVFTWATDVSHPLLGSSESPASPVSGSVPTTARLLAVIAILGINVSAQAIQVGARALIVDHCPRHLQSQANAWASRIVNTASLLVYGASAVNLPRLLPFLGDTQVKVLSFLGSGVLLVTLCITCLGIRDVAPVIDDFWGQRSKRYNLLKHFQEVVTSLPSEIHRIHVVQWFSWLAWYPYLVYISK